MRAWARGRDRCSLVLVDVLVDALVGADVGLAACGSDSGGSDPGVTALVGVTSW